MATTLIQTSMEKISVEEKLNYFGKCADTAAFTLAWSFDKERKGKRNLTDEEILKWIWWFLDGKASLTEVDRKMKLWLWLFSVLEPYFA